MRIVYFDMRTLLARQTVAVAFKHCLAGHVFKPGRRLLPCAKLSFV